MAVVVGVTTVVTQEAHGVALGNVLGVVLHELLGAVPKGGDGLDVLVQTQDEAVLLVVLLHEAERVVVDVAEKLNGGLDTPVVVVVHHGGLAEEESRLETAHVTVADRVTVDDLALGHVLANLACLLLVNVLGERPVLLGNLAVDGLAGHKGGSDLLEGGIERLVVQEDPIVVVAAVEAVLNLANGTGNVPDIRVTGEGDEGRVHAGTRGDAAVEVVPAGLVRGHGHGPLLGVVLLASLEHVGWGLARGVFRFLRLARLALLTLLSLLTRCSALSRGLEAAILEPHTLVAGVGDEVEDGETLGDRQLEP
ncbi:hypothetical protein CCHR01_07576 [Colletotrichum chrysophilum]|uniref:NAD-specific glutamate dehydrogenase n=1 Tax=Colletotrichum chrysophilum TaxID=1836956 RepID=A0AAD9AJV7_9PEZI|nr:hypothetical protein CCHR01_07576 [Colletotrichum chrysophilum]